VLASWWPHFNGMDQICYIERDGNKLTLKSAPRKFPETGKDVVISVSFERVESLLGWTDEHEQLSGASGQCRRRAASRRQDETDGLSEARRLI
jgi:hypothetical protein